MSAATATDAQASAKPKSKKLLLIIMAVVVLALIGAGAAFFLLKKNTAEFDEGEGEEPAPAAVQHNSKPRTPPTFLALDSMVVNLADPGGNRFVQLGITLQLQDTQTGEDMKVYMPSIRNGVLLLISQRTSDEMLQVKGKEQLSKDIIAEISDVMGYEVDAPEDSGAERKTKRRRAPPNPVQAVLFSSFIVQ